MTRPTTMSRPYDVFRKSQFGNNPVAECSSCKQVCVHWDADDLDDEGRLMHDCPNNVWDTVITDVGEGFCPMCEREAPFHYDNCPLYVRPPHLCECGAYACTTDHDLNTDALRDAFAGEERP